MVEALVRYRDRDDIMDLPGAQKARRARTLGERIHKGNYLNRPRVLGFTGVYRPFAKFADVLVDGRASAKGARTGPGDLVFCSNRGPRERGTLHQALVSAVDVYGRLEHLGDIAHGARNLDRCILLPSGPLIDELPKKRGLLSPIPMVNPQE